jgi:cobyrinic acid a,c-diamide synthase
MTARALMVAAPRSGGGKTTVTLGLLAALRRRGVAVRAAKSGPDYIDPAFHAAATGREGRNLDSWAMPPALLDRMLAEAAGEASLLLVEGAMGLFDGIGGAPGRSGAPADLAARWGLPVLLVLDVSGQSGSAAAVLRGFASHDPAVRVAGAVLNRVGSDRHRRLVEEAIAPLGIPVLGALPRDAVPVLPERHLGLVQAEEHPALEAALAALAEMAERHIDLNAVSALGAPLPTGVPARQVPLAPPGQRIALARDAAFSFLYPHVLAGWRAAGAEILPFSPLADEAPPADCDACWLPGGYPELHAGRLAAAARFLGGLRAFADARPVHGECGGHMVLGQGIVDAEGARHAMAGLLTHASSFARRRLHLGYRRATLLADGPLGAAGTVLRGHEFHYATSEPGADEPLAAMMDGEGRDLPPMGGRRGWVSGSFFHVIARETP